MAISSDPPAPTDVAIAAVCFVAFTGPVLVGMVDGIGSLPAIAAFGVAAVAPLMLRRRWPVAVLVAVSAVLCAAAVLGIRFTPWVSNTGPAIAVAVFTVADRRMRRDSLLATAAAVVTIGVFAQIGMNLHPGQDQNAVQLLIAAPAWLLGDMARTRRKYRHNLAVQQRHRAEETERRIRAEERLRVSRDVHDLLSHTLSMVAVRSGVARLLIDEQPGAARAALSTIETASRSALDELRRVLAQIREPGPPPDTDDPGLPEIADLADGMRHQGLKVEYQIVGQPADYPPLLQTTAYRIVQEALTNVVKHARTDRARIEIRHAPQELIVSVVDDGPRRQVAGDTEGAGGIAGSGNMARTGGIAEGRNTAEAGSIAEAENIAEAGSIAEGGNMAGAGSIAGGGNMARSGSGLGLVGMRERVALFGGRLTAGPRAEGGFAVVAALPFGQGGDVR
ncbi:sensor histidine kinase [Nocardia wallacei]|uniref:sensor histidine kinase n=1 Tax=Nocardia wallacei TaxID=480035 RepID=UPI002458C636|nr:histidine kinase [Nocardia wallacei]